ncbi:aldo/keto reductase [Paenibacillus sp. FSL R7-277]|uniref:aldo/keto reductase n=1 Tax=Paenibacillus sp. FSL R7-277 TaxID=1227352 RepID=UPI0003E1C5C3|nr:aldo/keto reductase [Paenibacillus sp. FSL R7-277]ETT64357.1 aldo/keto reductase [Paenibacillus sp. FSL R7-277]
MRYNRLGNSGLQVSALGLGTNSFGKRADQETSVRILHTAMDQGINFIDTANIYAGSESERIIGLALEGKRHNAVLATKAGLPKHEGPGGSGSSRHHLMQELEGSLRRLKTDYVDLYQIHTFDPYTPLEETLRTLDDLISAGKVRYIGASNYAAWELMKALGISEARNWAKYISIQCSYSLADRTPEAELLPLCLDQGLGIIPYFPLAGGILTGKYTGSSKVPAGSRAETDPNFRRFLTPERISLGEQVQAIAERLGTSPAALSLAWLMNRPAVSTVIVGATTVEQVQHNLQSLSASTDAGILEQLDQASAAFRTSEPFAVYRLP